MFSFIKVLHALNRINICSPFNILSPKVKYTIDDAKQNKRH